MQFLLRLVYPLPILTINNEHQALSAGVVVSPKGTDFILPSYIPYIKLDVLVCDSLYIEADCDSILTRGIRGISWIIGQTHLSESS